MARARRNPIRWTMLPPTRTTDIWTTKEGPYTATIVWKQGQRAQWSVGHVSAARGELLVAQGTAANLRAAKLAVGQAVHRHSRGRY